MSSELASKIREELVSREGVQRIAPVRRGTTIYGPDAPSDSVYFVDSGYVKLVQRGGDGKEVILSIIAPGSLFGERSLYGNGARGVSAQMLQDGSLYQIPRSVFLAFAATAQDVWKDISEQLLRREQSLEEKVSLLCLHDVEYRILHYLLSLGQVFGVNGSSEYSIPLSQSELAHLIGATRETTSTTLNTLARRGIVKLGRRLLMVASVETVRAALADHYAPPKQISASVAATQNA